MTFVTHVLFGVTCYIPISALLGYPPTLSGAALAAFGALLPDIDEPRSWIGRRFLFLSQPLRTFFGHRGITHSLAFCILIGALLGLLSHSYALPEGLALAILIGYASHLIADAVTPGGIPLMWPFKGRYSTPCTVRTGGAGEMVIFFVLLVGLVLAIAEFTAFNPDQFQHSLR
ncbi:hypothetical protein CKO15_00265 [Halorhodospira abdelmalekii]|uniref:metal-dependent hydrolase n=1 Tax=Halorhodospira abdelmalekii TaxID=421629 RepID=UPI001906FD8F|nr:metal-dependent hydrolase [Halorhodospira abdelmalekii]MBK1733740.1 hypothetical protein [Halorhodospira abdelmalekii]